MAIDDADQPESGQVGSAEEAPGERPPGGPISGAEVRVGNYSWEEFMREHGHGEEVDALYEQVEERREAGGGLSLESGDEVRPAVPRGDDWDVVDFDPQDYLGFHPNDIEALIRERAAANAKYLRKRFYKYLDPEQTPVVKDLYTWEHFKKEYYYEADGSPPTDRNGQVVPFRPAEYLGFDPDATEERVGEAGSRGETLKAIVDERSVNVQEELDEDAFFSTPEGHTTVVNRYDLEKAVPIEKKKHFVEEERYWVNKPYSFIVLFHSRKENEKKYYAIEPNLNEIEDDLREFLTGKLRNAIKYADDEVTIRGDQDKRREVIERETRKLLRRYDLFEKSAASTANEGSFLDSFREMLGQDLEKPEQRSPGALEGMSVRPEPIVLEEDPDTLSEYQVEKLLYYLKRNFIGYERIDPIKHDINVEDISCDGYEQPVFCYHTEYEQIISNVYHGTDDLDDFVVKMAQRAGKGISKRRPQVDATLPDGSRSQLTLGREVSDRGTNYTIRQFKDVPFTPVDLINWNTFALDQMAYLWLCIENNKSLIFAGGTASGKTTSLNAVSLFIPSNTKVVSIEDTREVELPQRNWVASMTRPSFSEDQRGDIDEFDLLEAALRQRPDYIVFGEVRGEEGRYLFQVMSTGHTTYTTFHADTVGEVLKRFTTDPINVSKTMFTALDLVSIQTQTRVQGQKVRRNKKLTEVNHYDAETDEINVQDVYQWQAETDEFLKMSESNTLEEIKFDRGWSQQKLDEEMFKRRVILAYLIKNGLNTYTEVAATIQAFINDQDTIMALVANGQLEESLEDLREMESVEIDIDPEKEELVPRPDPTDEVYNEAQDILERADEALFDEYRGEVPAGLASAVSEIDESEADAELAEGEAGEDFDFGGSFDEGMSEFEVESAPEDEFTTATGEEEVADAGPDWLSDEGGFDFDDSEEAEADPTPPELEDGTEAAAEAAGDELESGDAEELPDEEAAGELEGEDDQPTPPELEDGEEPIFGSPDDEDEELFDDAESMFEESDAESAGSAGDEETGEDGASSDETSIFNSDAAEGSLFDDEEDEELFSEGSGSGMFGTSDDADDDDGGIFGDDAADDGGIFGDDADDGGSGPFSGGEDSSGDGSRRDGDGGGT